MEALPEDGFVHEVVNGELVMSPKNNPYHGDICADLAIEVLSPNQSRDEIDAWLRDFFASGTQIAWIINPEAECVEVCYSLDRRKLRGPGADLEGEHLLPGFGLLSDF